MVHAATQYPEAMQPSEVRQFTRPRNRIKAAFNCATAQRHQDRSATLRVWAGSISSRSCPAHGAGSSVRLITVARMGRALGSGFRGQRGCLLRLSNAFANDPERTLGLDLLAFHCGFEPTKPLVKLFERLPDDDDR